MSRPCTTRFATSLIRPTMPWMCSRRCSVLLKRGAWRRRAGIHAVSVRRYKERRRERFLTPEEYRRLGGVLDDAEEDGSVWPSAIAALRLLMLTGCRKNEIVTLRWDDVDRTAGELRLRDSKTGARRVPLTPAVEAVLAGIPPHRRQPLGHCGPETGRASGKPRFDLDPAAGAPPGWGMCGSMTSDTPMHRGRWRSARGCR